MKHMVFVGGMYGDESKGASVEYAAWQHNAEWVVRFSGGANAGHNLVTPSLSHTACQIGSGVLVGAKTFLTKDFRVAPVFLMYELAMLADKGIDATKSLYMDKDCLITTPYHTAESRALAPIHARGTTGVGVGVTARYAAQFPDYAIRVSDLLDRPVLKDKLERLSCFYASSAATDRFINSIPDPINDLVNLFSDFAASVNVISCADWKNMSLIAGRDVIYEGSQGYWLDTKRGVPPNVTSSNVTYDNALQLVDSTNDVERWMCLRIYATRHGTGEFSTHSPELDTLLPELHNESTHQYQGVFRRGWLDIGKLKESVDGLGGVDYLAVSHLDYWCNLPEWEMYENGKFLFSTNSMNEYLAFMQTYLGVKIGMMAFGPTKEDREWTR